LPVLWFQNLAIFPIYLPTLFFFRFTVEIFLAKKLFTVFFCFQFCGFKSLAIFQIYLASLLLLFQVYTFKNEKFQKIPIFLAKE